MSLQRQVQAKIASKRDPEQEKQAMEWIATVTGENIVDAGMWKGLGDGVILCNLINKLQPGSVKKIHSSGSDFKLMENINNFLTACRSYGVPQNDLFPTVDLFEGKDLAQVTATIFALGRTTYQHPEFAGPNLGPKPAEECKREFSDEVLAAGKTAIGLQAGSNKGATSAGQNLGARRL